MHGRHLAYGASLALEPRNRTRPPRSGVLQVQTRSMGILVMFQNDGKVWQVAPQSPFLFP